MNRSEIEKIEAGPGKFEKLLFRAVAKLAEMKLQYDNFITADNMSQYDELKKTSRVKLIPPAFWQLFRTKRTRRRVSCVFCEKIVLRKEQFCTLSSLHGKYIAFLHPELAAECQSPINLCPECFLACILVMYYRSQK